MAYSLKYENNFGEKKEEKKAKGWVLEKGVTWNKS